MKTYSICTFQYWTERIIDFANSIEKDCSIAITHPKDIYAAALEAHRHNTKFINVRHVETDYIITYGDENDYGEVYLCAHDFNPDEVQLFKASYLYLIKKIEKYINSK